MAGTLDRGWRRTLKVACEVCSEASRTSTGSGSEARTSDAEAEASGAVGLGETVVAELEVA